MFNIGKLGNLDTWSVSPPITWLQEPSHDI